MAPRMSFRRLALASILLALPSVLACSSSADDTTSSQEQETRVKPDGSDDPGSLVVVAPGALVGDVQVTNASVHLAKAKLGETIGPLASRPVDVRVISGPFNTTAQVPIAAKGVTTYELGSLAVDYAGVPITLGLSSEIRTTTSTLEPLVASDRERAGSPRPDNAEGALVSGKYRFDFGLADGFELEVVAGKATKVRPAEYAERRVAKLVAPVRELPTAPCALVGRATTPLYTLTYAGDRNASVSMPDGSAFEVGLAAWREGSFELQFAGVQKRAAVPVGAKGAGPLELKIGRLDVDDVAVTKDGVTTPVRGTYQIFAIDPETGAAGSNLVSCDQATSLPTSHGIDLPRGKYKVVVTYPTTESGSKQDIHVVDVE